MASAGVALIIASKNVPSSISSDTGWTVFCAGGLLLVLGSPLLGKAQYETGLVTSADRYGHRCAGHRAGGLVDAHGDGVLRHSSAL